VQGGALRYDACKLSSEPKQNQATKLWVKIRASAGPAWFADAHIESRRRATAQSRLG